MSLYPLKFRPRLVEKIWGGRKLQTVLNKPLPADGLIGESWEIYDFPPGVVNGDARVGNGHGDGWVSAVVANGPLAGRRLHDLILQYNRDLYGDVALAGDSGQQFPVLIKYLDARENLSVQVHPDAEYVASHPEAHLKTEAWYIVDHDPGANLYKGLRPGTDREVFAKAIHHGSVEQLIPAIPVKAGQCHYLPSGTVHALGAGILVAEVQTPSDTTFRVHDFGRIDPTTGEQRDLHVEEALECIDFAHRGDAPQTRSHVASYFTTVTRLVSCPFFTLEKVRFSEGVEEAVPYDQPVVWMMLEGEAQVSVRGLDQPVRFARGETVLLPAAMDRPTLKTLTDCAWLEVTLPAAPR